MTIKEKLFDYSAQCPMTGCWLWTRATVPGGYGKICFDKKIYDAHRISYEVFKGRPPGKLFVLHKCDTRACVNPYHLFLGTQKDNIRDMYAKDRQNRPKGESNHSKLKNSDVLKIRKEFSIRTVTIASLSKKYRIDRSVISRILSGHSWKHI